MTFDTYEKAVAYIERRRHIDGREYRVEKIGPRFRVVTGCSQELLLL